MPAHLIAEDGPQRGLIFDLSDGEEWIIGRDPDTCDFLLEDSTVSRKHARLSRTEEGIHLKNLSRVNPSLVNDEQHKKPVLLQEGDRVQIGATTFLFSEEAIPDLEGGETPSQDRGEKTGYDDIFEDLDGSYDEEISVKKEPQEDLETPEPSEDLPPEPLKPEVSAYDTIFEDTNMDDDLSFHFAPKSGLILKVLSGPNAGAEIGLEKGHSYTIGKDPSSSDITFQDLSVSKTHARLSIGENGELEIEDLQSKNGTALKGQLIQGKTLLDYSDTISCGTTVFMIIDQEEPQETIYASSLEPVEEKEEKEISPKKKDWKKEPIPTKHWIFAGATAAAFLIIFLSFFSLFKSNPIEEHLGHPNKEIEKALKKYSDVQFSFNPASGKLFVVGHVLTNVDYQEMRYRLSQIEAITSMEESVVIDEGVWKMMNDLLASNPKWQGVSIHAFKAGEFVVNGYIPTVEEAVHLSEYLTVNFPYLDRLKNEVVIEQNLQTKIASLVSEENLGAVSFQLTNGQLVLSGQYGEDKKEAFDEFLSKIERLKGIERVQNFAIAVHPNKVGIDISSQYRVSGMSTYDGEGYSVVMNGKIYTIGDFVAGMKITSIGKNAILLEKDGLKYKIDYTR